MSWHEDTVHTCLMSHGRDGDDDEGDCGEEDASDEKTKSEMFCMGLHCVIMNP